MVTIILAVNSQSHFQGNIDILIRRTIKVKKDLDLPGFWFHHVCRFHASRLTVAPEIARRKRASILSRNSNSRDPFFNFLRKTISQASISLLLLHLSLTLSMVDKTRAA